MDIPPSPPRRFSFSPQGSPPTRLVHKIRLEFRRGPGGRRRGRRQAPLLRPGTPRLHWPQAGPALPSGSLPEHTPPPSLEGPPTTPSKTPPLAAWNRPTLYLFMLFETSFTVNPLCLKRHTPIMQQRPALFLSNRSGRYIADHHGIRLPRNNPSLGHTPSKASRTYRRVQVRVQSYFSAAPLGHLD